jgi:hypothetical protein
MTSTPGKEKKVKGIPTVGFEPLKSGTVILKCVSHESLLAGRGRSLKDFYWYLPTKHK